MSIVHPWKGGNEHTVGMMYKKRGAITPAGLFQTSAVELSWDELSVHSESLQHSQTSVGVYKQGMRYNFPGMWAGTHDLFISWTTSRTPSLCCTTEAMFCRLWKLLGLTEPSSTISSPRHRPWKTVAVKCKWGLQTNLAFPCFVNKPDFSQTKFRTRKRAASCD